MDKRKEHKRLFDLEYPTRQDMRECMWLGKEIIEQLEQEIVNYENTLSNSDYAKCKHWKTYNKGGSGEFGVCDCGGKLHFKTDILIPDDKLRTDK